MSRFEGDPKLFLDEDGAYIIEINGQPIMDRGLENAVLVALLTLNDDYWGNYLETDQNEILGSNFIDANDEPVTVDLLNTKRTDVLKALQFLLDLNIATEINVNVTSPTYNGFVVKINIVSPKNQADMLLTNFGDNWYWQHKDPAYKKDVQ